MPCVHVRVAARSYLAQDFLYGRPRRRKRDCRARTERDPSLLPPEGVLHQIALAAARRDANAEAALLVIENQQVFRPDRAFKGLDSALRKLHRPASLHRVRSRSADLLRTCPADLFRQHMSSRVG
jgi:hypothetical protein